MTRAEITATEQEFADRGLCFSCAYPVNECNCNIPPVFCPGCGLEWEDCDCEDDDSDDDYEPEDDGQPTLYEEYDGLYGNYYYMECYDTEY